MKRAGGPPTRRRPTAGEHKSERVELRFGTDDLASLDLLAAAWELTRSETVRLAVDKSLDQIRRTRRAKLAGAPKPPK